MPTKSSSTSILSSKSIVSSGLVIVNRPEGYTITGSRVAADSTFNKLIVTPGSPDSVTAISGGGGNASPTVTSIVVTDASWIPTGLNVIDSVAGGYIEINGTNFDSGVLSYLNGNPITTTYVNSTKLRVVVPSTPAGLYNLIIFNSNNTGVIYSNLSLSVSPTFSTPAGSLGSFYESANVNLSIQANADSVITYSISSGSLPGNLILQANGNIRGTISSGYSSNTNYPFNILATDAESQSSTRSFSLSVMPDAVTIIPNIEGWEYVLSNGDVMSNITLSGNALSEQFVTFSANVLPSGASLTNNIIYGTINSVANVSTLLTGTAQNSNKTKTANVSFRVVQPWTVSNYKFITNGNCFPLMDNNHYFFIDPSETRLYTVSPVTDTLKQYSISRKNTIFGNVAAATFIGNIDMNVHDTGTSGVDFKPDGTKFYISGNTNSKIYEFSMSAAWNISTATKIGEVTVTTSPSGIKFNSDGTKFYITNVSNAAVAGSANIYEYKLTSAYQVNTAVITNTFALANITSVQGFDFSSDFTKLYAGNIKIINQYNLSIAGQVNTAAYNSTYEPAPIQNATITNEGPFNRIDGRIKLNSSGSNAYIGIEGNVISLVNLTTANSISTANIHSSLRGIYWFGNKNRVPRGIYIKPDGTKHYMVGGATANVYEFTMPSPYNIESSIFTGNVVAYNQLGGAGGQVYGVSFKDDGLKMFTIQLDSDISATKNVVKEYKLSTAWQVNTAVLTGNIIPTDTTVEDLTFSSDGTKIFLAGAASDLIYEMKMSTAWQVNTAVQIGTLDISTREKDVRGLSFKPDGTTVFLIGGTGANARAIHQYSLSTAWQVNSAVYSGNIIIGDKESSPSSIAVTSDGKYLYFTGTDKKYLLQYDLN